MGSSHEATGFIAGTTGVVDWKGHAPQSLSPWADSCDLAAGTELELRKKAALNPLMRTELHDWTAKLSTNFRALKDRTQTFDH